jgi:Holliday junction resolvase RusA-like endonuclease
MAEWKRHVPVYVLEGPVQVNVVFVCARPKNPAQSYPKGDIDNYIKGIWDSLNGHFGFQDDKQIVRVTATKRYQDHAREEEPHIKILIWRTDVHERYIN